MKENWYTLAESSYGTHKMRFKEEMAKEKAVEIGKQHCEISQLTYIGTYDGWQIDEAEIDHRNNQK